MSSFLVTLPSLLALTPDAFDEIVRAVRRARRELAVDMAANGPRLAYTEPDESGPGHVWTPLTLTLCGAPVNKTARRTAETRRFNPAHRRSCPTCADVLKQLPFFGADEREGL